MPQPALFDDAEPATAEPSALATPDQIAELVRCGRSEKLVATWSREKAAAVIESERREYRTVRNRAEAKAEAAGRRAAPDTTHGVPDPPTPPSAAMRAEVARYLEQAIAAGDPDELTHALMYSAWAFTHEECVEFARLVVCQLKVKAR